MGARGHQMKCKAKFQVRQAVVCPHLSTIYRVAKRAFWPHVDSWMYWLQWESKKIFFERELRPLTAREKG